MFLRAERKRPQTIKSYCDGVKSYVKFCDANGYSRVLDRRQVQEWVAALLNGGASPATAIARQLGVRRFSAWATDEGEQSSDPLSGLKRPRLDTPVVPPLSDEQLRALIAACRGRDFRDRRDEAILRLMIETGMRIGEVVALQIDDVNLQTGVAIVRRGKGGKGRVVPFGPHTARAIDRYIRVRRQHRLAETSALWLGDRSKGFTYDAAYASLKKRANAAGVADFWPHKLRNTAADRWLSAGGSESGLMAVAGWERHDQLQRYTKFRAADRAVDEARSLNLDEI